MSTIPYSTGLFPTGDFIIYPTTTTVPSVGNSSNFIPIQHPLPLFLQSVIKEDGSYYLVDISGFEWELKKIPNPDLAQIKEKVEPEPTPEPSKSPSLKDLGKRKLKKHG
jgi:hypothetical protein